VKESLPINQATAHRGKSGLPDSSLAKARLSSANLTGIGFEDNL
jgi:hypothetical protein